MNSLKLIASSFLDEFYTRFSHSPLSTGLITGAVVLSPLVIRNYLSFLSLKPSYGMANPLIYLLSLTLKFGFSRETLTTAEYVANGEVKGSWLKSSLPRRKGDRPTIAWFPAPHRQLTQLGSEQMNQNVKSILREGSANYPDSVEIRRSAHEGHLDALFVGPEILRSNTDTTNGTRKSAYGEIAHVHSGFDYSVHVLPAPQDCKAIIDNGWGERHPCAGSIKGMPKEYILLYTPRNDEDLAVIKNILDAAIRFMTGEPALS
ncbi:hypothetical protein M422DRAFT_40794 [Sphaerobolus stellatus SS14]|nr:hypothetical protein M422DRAFT_40794 [Sphaerobolus stellatus SS14]